MDIRSTIATLCLLVAPLAVSASSHREAPAIKDEPSIDNTDVYAFRTLDHPETLTILANFNPFEEAAGGPNFHSFSDKALYEIHIDNDGDAVADMTYQFRFRTEIRNAEGTFLYNTGPVTTLDDADLNIRQFYDVTRMMDGQRSNMGSYQVAPANVGPRSMPDYVALADSAVANLPTGGRVFAGPRDDPFYVDLGAIFDLLTLRPIQQLHVLPPMLSSAPGIDTLKGYNVHTIAIQVPISSVTNNGQAVSSPTASNAIVGIWSTTSSPRVTILSAGSRPVNLGGGFVQVSRLGNPLVNEVVIPLALKDAFNRLEPRQDAGLFNSSELFRNRILDPELAKLMKLLYNVDVPAAPRNDLVSVFLTGLDGVNKPANIVPAEMLRINLGIPASAAPNRLGAIASPQDAAGFPNGRRLGDDVVDIALRVVAGVLVPGFNKAPNNALTDGVDGNDVPFIGVFPYAAHPHSGFDHVHHGAAQIN